MGKAYAYDIVDGREVPPLVVDRDYTLTGVHEGTVHVERGSFTLRGTLQGTLDIQENVDAIIAGSQQGSVSVGPGAVVKVSGAIEGSTTIARTGTVIIEGLAKLAGSLHNDGLLIVRGVFGGSQTGAGEIRLEGAGHIKEPTVVDGVACYRW